MSIPLIVLGILLLYLFSVVNVLREQRPTVQIAGLDVKTSGTEQLEESVEITIKYQGYIDREKNLADKIKKLYDLNIPEDVVYDELLSISTEGRQKLDKYRPETVGKASRLSGVSPSDISVLLMYMGR